MTNKLNLSILLVIIITILGFSINTPDNNPINIKKGKDYKELWQKVDSLENNGLPKSALKIIDKIYNESKKANNTNQIVKSFIYKLKFTSQFEEDAFENNINLLELEIKTAKYPTKNILQSILAQLYWQYYNNNRWKILQRSETTDFKNDDIKTWTINKITDKAIKNYLASLNNADSLQRTSILFFDDILVKGENTENLQPTLYDFLANIALDFFKNPEASLTKPADKFEIDNDKYFADATTFINIDVKTSDTLSNYYYAVKIYQKLTKFRKNDTNIAAFIDLELNRLNFIYVNSVNDKKDELYETALKQLLKKYSYVPKSADVIYTLASFYRNNASKYYYTDSTTYKFKEYNKKAYKLCEQAINKFSEKNIGVIKCVNLIDNIKQKDLQVTTENVITSNTNFVIRYSYRNIKKIYYKIGKISKSNYKKIISKNYGEALFKKLYSASDIIRQGNFDLLVDEDFNTHSTEYIMQGLDYGNYIIFSSNNKDFKIKDNLTAYNLLNISDISYVRKNTKNGGMKFYVLNRKSGVAMPNVKVDFYREKYSYVKRQYIKEKQKTAYTDKNGIVLYNNSKKDYDNIYVSFQNGKDKLESDNSYYAYRNRDYDKISNYIFTDRAIYRPGQTVYFKGISIDFLGDKRKIIPGKKVKVTFYDVNYQAIKTLDLTTNEYGTFNGSFKIPLGLLNGSMQIYTSYGSKNIRVEEYKRPKFETKLLPFDSSYKINQLVRLKGKATTYSGANLTDAKVTYTVTRQTFSRYYWYSYSNNKTIIKNGETTVNDNGIYNIEFKAIPDLKYKNDAYFYYSIKVDVTDINGETQSTSSGIYIGYVDLKLSTNLSGDIEKEKADTFEIYSTNLNGESIDSKGKILIYKLKTPDKTLRERKWQQPDKFLYTQQQWDKLYHGNVYKEKQQNHTVITQYDELVYEQNFDTKISKSFTLKNIKNLESGKYKIIFKSKDAFNSNVEYDNDFIIYSKNDKKLPYADKLLTFTNKTNLEVGDTAEILIGSSYDVTLHYDIDSRKNSVSKTLKINNNQTLIKIPVTEDLRGNFSVNGFFVYKNRTYSFSKLFSVPYTNKKLDITFATFRDKLLPGQKEKWQITIKDKKGDPVMAEMLAAMYDKSLDAFASNSFWLDIYPYFYNSSYWSFDMFNISNSRLFYYNTNYNKVYPNTTYNKLNWFGYYFYNYYGSGGYRYKDELYTMSGEEMPKKSRRRNGRGLLKTAEAEPPVAGYVDIDDESIEADKVLEETGAKQKEQTTATANTQEKNENNLSEIKARTNFNETAFFYPDLRTNSKGELVIEFTVPESLTKWKIIGLATTKDLKIGTIQKELITQKKLMVMPNPPRFFREGDKIEFPLKISNISDKELNVDYDIQLFDALTNKPILIDDFQKTILTIPAKGNKAVSAIITIPDYVDAIKYRVVAKSGNYSDAEENVIPVLSNRMLVTESLPLPINGNQTKSFVFKKLKNNKSKTLKNYKYTLEFTSNPAWYAVQSLPYLIEYPYECSEQTFNRFYANSLATFIANSSPKIKAVFDSWKNEKDSKALLSNLEKNQELKALMLEETPWVLDGKNESERKARIALLFNLNRMSAEMKRTLNKLRKSQSSNGGWPWFSGMPDDRYITQYIVSGMGHLIKLNVPYIHNDRKTWNMIKKAVNYTDNRISEDYNRLKKIYNKKELKEMHIDNTQIQYLYARSFYKDIPISQKNKEAYNYYLNQAKKYWTKMSIYSQGMVALALHRENKTEETSIEKNIMKSLKEKSINNDEMGMYWKDNVSGYFWYQAPIETQALLIEAFNDVANDKKAVEDLKKWLLKQKQTQNWKTTKATADAIYALLLNGTDLLASDKLVEIKIANKIIDPNKLGKTKPEAGTGYFKTSWTGKEITPEMGNITISKKDDGIAWGAVYWQYFENLDKITKHKTPLHLEKKLFIEKNTPNGKIIKPIDNNKIKVGDKIIVRIELRTDRRMEYVHMKDMRASGFEPINVISRYKYQDGFGYYETTKDASTNFFISNLPKGTYVFEYPLRATHKGNFSNGITTIQCMYAPEFTSHSEGIRVNIE